MYEGKLVFAQLMDHLPMHTLRRTVERFGGDRWVKSFSCQEQFKAMASAQLSPPVKNSQAIDFII